MFVKQAVPAHLMECAPLPEYHVETNSDAANFVLDMGDAYTKTCANLGAVKEIVK